MKKVLIIVILILSSCKTTKPKCDAYSNLDDKELEFEKKYVSYEVIK